MKKGSMRTLQIKQGRILLWRLGKLEFGEQSAWEGAPAKKGLWAFPYPYFDEGFAYHQYSYLLPKRLRELDNGYPMHISGYDIDESIYSGKTVEDIMDDKFQDNIFGEFLPEGVKIRQGFHEEREQWCNTVGKKILPIRKFWYEGELYSHIDRRGQVGDVGEFSDSPEWYKHDASTFGKLVKKAGGDTEFSKDYMDFDGRLRRRKTGASYLEVFIEPGRGKISG